MNSLTLRAEKIAAKTKDTKSPFLLQEDPDGTMFVVPNPDYRLDLRWHLIHFFGYGRTDATYTVIRDEEAFRQILRRNNPVEVNEFFNNLMWMMKNTRDLDYIVTLMQAWLEIRTALSANNRA